IYEREHRPNEAPRARLRPLGRYLAASAVASVCGLVISFVFHSAIFWSFAKGLDRLLVVYPWFGLTFLTTIMTAVCLDDTAPPARRGRLRAIEAGATALVMLLGAYGVWVWLTQVAARGAASDYKVPPLLGVVMISTSIGLFIGSFVPTWYREAPRS